MYIKYSPTLLWYASLSKSPTPRWAQLFCAARFSITDYESIACSSLVLVPLASFWVTRHDVEAPDSNLALYSTSQELSVVGCKNMDILSHVACNSPCQRAFSVSIHFGLTLNLNPQFRNIKYSVYDVQRIYCIKYHTYLRIFLYRLYFLKKKNSNACMFEAIKKYVRFL